MNVLFKTSLEIRGNATTYEVIFENEVYHFQPINEKGLPLRIRREEDEWHSDDAIDAQTKTAATEALDAYLLSQH